MNDEFYKNIKVAQIAIIKACKSVSQEDCRGGKCPFDNHKGGCIIHDMRNAILDALENQ